MSKSEIQNLIDTAIAGQGSAVDVGGALPKILSNILALIPAEQVQADWSQHDSEEVDFIKHKPVFILGESIPNDTKITITFGQMESLRNALYLQDTNARKYVRNDSLIFDSIAQSDISSFIDDVGGQYILAIFVEMAYSYDEGLQGYDTYILIEDTTPDTYYLAHHSREFI